jgi:hypothetical protein
MVRLAWLCWISAVSAGLLAPVSARGQAEFGDMRVECLPASNVTSGHGYQDLWISLTNRSPQIPHRVTLTVPRPQFAPPGPHFRRDVVVGRQATERVWLLESVQTLPYDLEVKIDGKSQLVSVGGSFYTQSGFGGGSGNYRSGSSHQPALCISPAVADALRQRPNPLTAHVQWLESKDPVTAWSDHWLGYSAFDGILVTSTDMRTMPPAVQAALWGYVECGGALLIVGPWEVPAHWKSRQVRFGSLSSYGLGFGQCLVLDEKDLSFLKPEHEAPLSRAWSASRSPFNYTRTIAEANRAFPVVADEALVIPVRGLFILMILFVVIIGPINLVVLSRLGHRIWLLWTVPAIALATCLGVFLYMLLTEGWQSQVRTEGITVLDEAAGRAASIGWTALYCPVAPGGGLHFGYDTELTPQLRWSRATSSAITDWTEDQHLLGWVRPRIPLHFEVRTCAARSERVTVTKTPDGRLMLVNGLPAAIRTLTLADQQGRIFTAADIPAGGEALLTAAGRMPDPAPVEVLRLQIYQQDWLSALGKLRTEPQDYLRPGCYLATLDAAPFFESGLRNAGARRESSVVYGIMKEPVDAN